MSKSAKKVTQSKIVRSSLGLRDCLFDEIDMLRNGESNPQRAAALAKLSVQIINTVNLEIDYQRTVASSPTSFSGMSTVPLKLSAE